jgi:hypothetical protein
MIPRSKTLWMGFEFLRSPLHFWEDTREVVSCERSTKPAAIVSLQINIHNYEY